MDKKPELSKFIDKKLEIKKPPATAGNSLTKEPLKKLQPAKPAPVQPKPAPPAKKVEPPKNNRASAKKQENTILSLDKSKTT